MSDDTRTPELKAPPGACDTHIHIFGPERDYPIRSANAFPPPPNSSVTDYRSLQERLGLGRVVVVQPAAYADDNSCTVDALEALGDRARGVAVVAPRVDDAELRRLTDASVCGLRFFMLTGGALGWDVLEAMAARVASFGWHIQLQLDGRDLDRHEAMLMRLPGTLVIDHVGKFLEPDHPGFQTLLRLVDGGNCWVKLSAPYETSKLGPPHYADVGKLGKALLAAAPERMVWASNWPHPSAQDHLPDDAVLLDVLLDWIPDAATRHRVLVDNPAELYGF